LYNIYKAHKLKIKLEKSKSNTTIKNQIALLNVLSVAFMAMAISMLSAGMFHTTLYSKETKNMQLWTITLFFGAITATCFQVYFCSFLKVGIIKLSIR